MKRKCNCWDKNSKKRCNKPLFIILKVQVYHPNSKRKSWQTWYLCKDCYDLFRESDGKDWGCRYKEDKKPFAPLIQYKIY